MSAEGVAEIVVLVDQDGRATGTLPKVGVHRPGAWTNSLYGQPESPLPAAARL
ncbi:MAG: hypothetical protein JWO11_1476 [Nocardioides sp.]|nr:hypothetical protein [Nocardioides sp.]